MSAISIKMITGENGTLNKASESRIERAHSETYERLALENQAYYALVMYDNYNGTVIDYLEELNYIEEDGKVNMRKLLDNHLLATGNGKEGKDIYKVEEKKAKEGELSKHYNLNYYDENGEVRIIRRITR